MDWITQHWQTLAALGVVAATLLVFVRRALGRKDRRSCGGGCGCGVKKP